LRPGARGLGSVVRDDAMTAASGHVETLETWSPQGSSFSPGRRPLRPSRSHRRGPRRGTQPQSRGCSHRPSESHRCTNALTRGLPQLRCCNRLCVGMLPRRLALAKGGVVCRPFMPGPLCVRRRRGVSDPARGARRRPQARPAGSLTPRMSVSPRGPVCHEKLAPDRDSIPGPHRARFRPR
jgi:hypothetical protein